MSTISGRSENRTATNSPDVPVLELDSVSKHYLTSGFGGLGERRVEVLTECSFSLMSGEVLSVIGESGAGKTTIGRLILGREKVSQGRILHRGREIQIGEKDSGGIRGLFGARQSRGELYRSIQYVPQGTQENLNPFLTVRDHLQSILRRRGYSSNTLVTRMDELMNHVGLRAEFYSRYPSQLSGGQRQRLLIARALAMEPEVIIFDEPVASLDVSIQARILNTLSRLRKQFSLSYIFITHDLDIAEYISDRIAVLHNGRIVECSPVESLVSAPSHPYTRSLLDASLKKDNWDS